MRYVFTRVGYWLSMVCLVAFATPAAAQQYAYYVSTEGSDTNPGTEAQPFQTVEKARDTIRVQTRSMTQDILVNLRAGTYRVDHTLAFDQRDSGLNGHNIIYKSYPGEKVSICGGRKVVGWTQDPQGRWTAHTDIPNFRQLYVNGKRAVRARGATPGGMELLDDGYRISQAEMVPWRNPADLEFVYDIEWERDICKVASITKDGTGTIIKMLQPYFTLARIKGGLHVSLPTYIENALELLDEPGEWYLDRQKHVVFYLPRPSEDLQEVEVIAPAVEKLLEIQGTLAEPAHNIQFEGITFCHGSWLQPSEIGHIDVQANFTAYPNNLIARSDGSVANLHNECHKSPANVVLHGAQFIRFERCIFEHLGGAGVDLEYGSQSNVISGCDFHDISGSGIQVGDVVDHHPRDSREIVKNNQIIDNHIHDAAVEYTAGVGVFAGYTDGTVIAHNEISDLPYTGISIGWGWGEEDPGGGAYRTGDPYYQPFYYKEPTVSRNVRCEYNHIHRVMLQRNDGGGIYTLSIMPGTVIRGNLIHDNVGHPGGIYLDEGSGRIEVTRNVVYNVSKPMNYNNLAQNRIATCNEHDNFFSVKPAESSFPKDVAGEAGLEPEYLDLLQPSRTVRH